MDLIVRVRMVMVETPMFLMVSLVRLLTVIVIRGLGSKSESL